MGERGKIDGTPDSQNQRPRRFYSGAWNLLLLVKSSLQFLLAKDRQDRGTPKPNLHTEKELIVYHALC